MSKEKNKITPLLSSSIDTNGIKSNQIQTTGDFTDKNIDSSNIKTDDELSKMVDDFFKTDIKNQKEEEMVSNILIEEDEEDLIPEKSKEVQQIKETNSYLEDALIRKILTRENENAKKIKEDIEKSFKEHGETIDSLFGTKYTLLISIDKDIKKLDSLMFQSEDLTIEGIKDVKIRMFVKNQLKQISESMIELFL